AARGHQVDDGVGQAHQRGQLHRAVELDDVHVHALGGEVLARGAHVFGGDAQARTLVHGGLVIEAFGGGHAEAAAGDVQVGGLVQAARVLRHVLVQHILAGDAEVGRAVLDVGGHV